MLDMLLMDPTRWPTGSLAAASIAALLWGLGSALMSPCHLGIIPLLSSHAAGVGPFEHDAHPTRPILDVVLFAIGYYITIPLFGLLISLFGRGLELGGHYWTIPAGLLMGWFGFDMMRGHNCSSASHLLELMGKRLGLGIHSGVMALGFGYGLLSGGCSVSFLVPVIMFSLSQGIAICLLFAACFGIGHCFPMVVVGCSASVAAKFLCNHHDEKGPHEGCHHKDPHRMEALFRRAMGILLLVISLLFILHPFLEHD